MLEFLHYILANMVSQPDVIKIETSEEGDLIKFDVYLAEEDRGVVIGKGGMNIKSIRNLVGIIARRENKKVAIKILD